MNLFAGRLEPARRRRGATSQTADGGRDRRLARTASPSVAVDDVARHPAARRRLAPPRPAGGVGSQRARRGVVEEVAVARRPGPRPARGAAPPLVAEVTRGSVERLGLREGAWPCSRPARRSRSSSWSNAVRNPIPWGREDRTERPALAGPRGRRARAPGEAQPDPPLPRRAARADPHGARPGHPDQDLPRPGVLHPEPVDGADTLPARTTACWSRRSPTTSVASPSAATSSCSRSPTRRTAGRRPRRGRRAFHWLFQKIGVRAARQRGLHQAGDRPARRHGEGEGRQGLRERRTRSTSRT